MYMLSFPTSNCQYTVDWITSGCRNLLRSLMSSTIYYSDVEGFLYDSSLKIDFKEFGQLVFSLPGLILAYCSCSMLTGLCYLK